VVVHWKNDKKGTTQPQSQIKMNTTLAASSCEHKNDPEVFSAQDCLGIRSDFMGLTSLEA